MAAASTIKPERLQVVDFSDPYYNSRQSLTVNTARRRTSPPPTSSSGDGHRRAEGDHRQGLGNGNLAPKGMQIKTYTNAPDAFTDLEAGNITGVINDEPSSESEVESRPDLKVVQPIDTGEHYGIAVAKDRARHPEGHQQRAGGDHRRRHVREIFGKYFPGVPVPPEFGG